jgi:hypothetical protein
MIVMNHPILHVILDLLNTLEIGELILIASVSMATIKVQQNNAIVLIADFDEFHDDMNPSLLPFLDQTQRTLPQ